MSDRMLEALSDDALDSLIALARQITGARAAFISIAEADRDRYLSHSGLPEPLATTRESSGQSFCELVLGRSTPLVIDDTSAEPVFAELQTVASLGIAAYLGAPVRSVEGEALGSFCLVDTVPRSWTSVEVELVTQLALAARHKIILQHPETGVAAAQQNQTLMRVAGAVARVGGWAVDVSDNSVYWSDEIHEILESGSAPDGLDIALDMYPPGERERIADALTACATDGAAFELDVVVRTYAGSSLEARVVGEPEYDDSGEVVRVVGAFQDISHQSAQARATKELAERLADTLESISDAFFSVDANWRITHLNANAERIAQRPRAELLARNLWDEFAPEMESAFFTAYHRVVETGEAEVVTAYHAPFDTWFEASAYPSANGLSVYLRDVSEERRSEIRLAERDRMLHQQRRLLDASQDAIIVSDTVRCG